MIENDALKIENCLNDAPCGYLRLDSNGRIFFANNTLLKWLNFELDNLTNKVWTFLLSGGSRIYEQTHFTPLLRMQGYVEEINLDLIDSKGDKIPFLINAKILVEDSTVDIFLFRFNQRKSYEKEILIAKKNAELSAKVKSEFLSNMSHEIRTPLNGIIGFSELLLSSKLDSSQEEYIRIINQAGNSLLELINDILDLSKLEAEKVELHIEKTNVYQLLEHCIDLIKFKANEKEIELLLYISPNVPEYIFTDPIRLRQVIINLLGNAVKFTEKGEIELRVEGNITNLNSNQIEISFTIRDTGIGISNEKQRVIFDAFSQADSSISQKYGGTGLGLTISNKLLKLFNSKLNVNSQPGKGSEFYFTVSSHFEINPNSEKDLYLDSFSALILDQNDRSRTIISKMLDDLRIKNKSSANIELALSSLDSNVFNLLIINNNLTSFSEFLNKSNNFNVYNDSKFTTILLLESTVADWNEDFQYPSNIVKIFKPLRKKDLVDVLINRFPNIVRKSLIKQQETLYSMVNENLKIMIVDDDEVNLFLAKTVLDLVMPKAHIVQFNNGLEALKNIEKENPNIIFLDLQMPELNGIETTIEIRKINSFKEVPIIAFSAGMIPEDLEKCKDAGMNDYLTKPVKKEDFQRVLEKWLSK